MKTLTFLSCLLPAPVVIFAQAKPLARDYRIVHHDADHATFHRVKNFRNLALKLTPEPEE